MKLHKIIVTAALGLLTWCPMNAEQPSTQNTNEYETLMKKIRADFVKQPDLKAVKEALKLYDPKTGAFKDIDYSRDDRTFWPPLNHITRLRELAYASIRAL